MRSFALMLSLALLTTGCRKDTDADADGSLSSVDCDDTDPARFPGNPEVCDGIDNDCNALVDDGASDATAYYADADGDGVGNDTSTVSACAMPAGYADVGGDCDDSNPAIHPGASETDCTDPIDYNCDRSVGYADNDADGYPACKDCNDSDAAVSPAGTEVCDGIDNNCDGNIDENAVGAVTWFADSDADTFGDPAVTEAACDQPAGYVANDKDCNDTNAGINPSAAETCDGVDQNCNDVIDEDSTDPTTWYADADGDGFGGPNLSQQACVQPAGYTTTNTDCDDLNAASYPGATEVCDGKDNNCDGAVPANETAVLYADVDGDGHGDLRSTLGACIAGPGYVASSDDCDDLNPNTYPGATEICDEKDNNCDGVVPASELGLVYRDFDGDTYGDPANQRKVCEVSSGYVADQTDCDDSRKGVHPGATEIAGDGLDNDCVGGDQQQLVYVPARYSGDLWAIDRSTGNIAWKISGLGESIDVKVGPDGTIYMSKYRADATGGVWAIDPVTKAVTTLFTGTPYVTGLWFDVSTNSLLVTSTAGTVEEVDVATGLATTLITGIPSTAIHAIRFPGDDKIYVSTRVDKAIRVWDPATPAKTRVIAILPGSAELMVPADDGTLWVGGGTSFLLQKVDLRNGNAWSVGNTGHLDYGICHDTVNQVMFSDHAASLYSVAVGSGFVDPRVVNSNLNQPWSCALNEPYDADGDGEVGRAYGGDDCNDRDPAINTQAADTSKDGIDQNCDFVDGTDADGDGQSSIATGGGDCDDNDATKFDLSGCGSPNLPADCGDLPLIAPHAPSGYYTISPDGSSPGFEAYCDNESFGGGWTLVARSFTTTPLPAGCGTPPGNAADNFGWKSMTGTVRDDTTPYSMNAGAVGLKFNEILFGDYTTGKVWGDNLYRHAVANDFLTTWATAHYVIGAPQTLNPGVCGPGEFAMATYIGFTNNTDTFHWRDVNRNGFGLSKDGWRTCYDIGSGNGCYGGNINTLPGMVMVR